jgi:hypothetical protein
VALNGFKVFSGCKLLSRFSILDYWQTLVIVCFHLKVNYKITRAVSCQCKRHKFLFIVSLRLLVLKITLQMATTPILLSSEYFYAHPVVIWFSISFSSCNDLLPAAVLNPLNLHQQISSLNNSKQQQFS